MFCLDSSLILEMDIPSTSSRSSFSAMPVLSRICLNERVSAWLYSSSTMAWYADTVTSLRPLGKAHLSTHWPSECCHVILRPE